jgi:hypothetical protein
MNKENLMSDKKIIAVLGATGAQGGGLARAILNDPSGGFAVRALTRNVNSDKAKALADLGVEVVTADVDDLESLKRAFTGAYGAFCVTFFWDHFSPEKEMAEAKAMAEAAKYADLKHVVWSTFEDTRNWVPLNDDRMPTLNEKYKVPHFDGKGGDKKLPGIAAEDIGKTTYGIFKKGDEFIGKSVGVAGEHLTGAQMAGSLTRALGQEILYNDVPADVYRSFDFPGADDVGNMFQFKRDFQQDYCNMRDLAVVRSLNPSLQTFDEWLAENGSRIPLG